jgi:hypothetical protein
MTHFRLQRFGAEFADDPAREVAAGGGERHLMIGGTGRAGTTFLVRYLTELGLDTELARHGDRAGVHPDADAGLENVPLPGSGRDLPYVVKSPWLCECIDELLADEAMRMDGVIIPIRPLTEAAASRSIVEVRSMYRSAPWMVQFDEAWETWCHTGGGTVFSLNPIDQGRLLAVGFHRLLERLVAADIRVVLLAFPRMATDWRYLFDRLRPFLPASVDADAARSAHRRVADLAKVHVGAEIALQRSAVGVMRHATHAEVDAIALRREMAGLRERLIERERSVAVLSGQLDRLRQRIDGGHMALAWAAERTRPLRCALAAWRLAALATLRSWRARRRERQAHPDDRPASGDLS